MIKETLSLLAGLLVSFSVAAQEDAADGLLLGTPTVTMPVRLPQGYQFSLSLDLQNNAEQASSQYDVRFVFVTIDGKAIPCRNLTLSAGQLTGDSINGFSLLPGQAMTLSGELLVPATWYRGPGTLLTRLQPCHTDAEGMLLCPEQTADSPPAVQVAVPLTLP